MRHHHFVALARCLGATSTEQATCLPKQATVGFLNPTVPSAAVIAGVRESPVRKFHLCAVDRGGGLDVGSRPCPCGAETTNMSGSLPQALLMSAMGGSCVASAWPGSCRGHQPPRAAHKRVGACCCLPNACPLITAAAAAHPYIEEATAPVRRRLSPLLHAILVPSAPTAA